MRRPTTIPYSEQPVYGLLGCVDACVQYHHPSVTRGLTFVAKLWGSLILDWAMADFYRKSATILSSTAPAPKRSPPRTRDGRV